jgi:hypothetical protein
VGVAVRPDQRDDVDRLAAHLAHQVAQDREGGDDFQPAVGPGRCRAEQGGEEPDLEAFDRLYRAIDLGDGGFITLLSDSGTLLPRIPDPGNVRGRKFPGGMIMKGVDREGRFEGWATSPISEERVLLATSAVRGFPLLVASGANESAVFEPWTLMLYWPRTNGVTVVPGSSSARAGVLRIGVGI